MAPCAPTIVLTSAEQQQLTAWVRAGTTPQRLARRARVILGSAAGLGSRRLAQQERMSRTTVQRWRTRFARAGLDGLRDRRAGDSRVDHFGVRVQGLVVSVQIIQGFDLATAGPPREDLQLACRRLVFRGCRNRRRCELAATDGRWRRTRCRRRSAGRNTACRLRGTLCWRGWRWGLGAAGGLAGAHAAARNALAVPVAAILRSSRRLVAERVCI